MIMCHEHILALETTGFLCPIQVTVKKKSRVLHCCYNSFRVSVRINQTCLPFGTVLFVCWKPSGCSLTSCTNCLDHPVPFIGQNDSVPYPKASKAE